MQRSAGRPTSRRCSRARWSTLGTRAIIDDLERRRCAEALGIPLRGTVGLVLRARRAGLIDSARERLHRGGMYLSDRLCTEVPKEVGE